MFSVPGSNMNAPVDAAFLSLDDPQAEQLSRAGGKGMNLARLTRAGFAVPAGFVITRNVIALQQEQLLPEIESALRAGGTADEISSRIRSAVLAHPVHEELSSAVRCAYQALIRHGGEG